MAKLINQNSLEFYQIKVRGRLDKEWSDWFEGMTINCEGDETVFTGRVTDQAALHGLLTRIRDLNLTLLSVNCFETKGDNKISKKREEIDGNINK